MEIKLKTLTPIWTGGSQAGQMDRIHETAIIGSLRWWYEAIVRGLGGDACDPTSDDPDERCQFDTKAYEEAKNIETGLANVCPVCRWFGCTGWRQRFRLDVVEDQTRPVWPPQKVLNIRPPDRTRGWYLPPGKMGTFILRFIGDDNALALVATLILFIEKWGTLGPKPQLGYGVVAIANREEIVEKAKEWIWAIPDKENSYANRPDFRNFGFVKFRFSPKQPGWWSQVPGLSRVGVQVQPLVSSHRTVPISPAMKNEWRFHQWQRSWGNDREIFGMLLKERRRSRVAVSWAYTGRVGTQWETRAWAWLPSDEKQPTGSRLWGLMVDPAPWTQVLGVTGDVETRRPTSGQDVGRLLEEAVK